MRDELADLVADVRALLEEEAARGVRAEPRDVPVVASITPAPAAEPARAAASSQWAKVAASSRAAADVATERGAPGLVRIREDLGDCRRCKLCKERRNIVYGVGAAEAALMVVGEGPGHDEDLKGEPFVGAAGQMLDKMLSAVVGLAREQVYIANVVKCRPPGNRNPEPEEIAACLPFLERQILAVRPKVILVLGSVALKALLTTPSGIMSMRGRWQSWQEIPVMPTFHPAYLLRNPADKRKTFEDLQELKKRLDGL